MPEQFQRFIDGINNKFTSQGKIKEVGSLFQSLKAIPGGLEMASVAIIENAYNKLRSEKYAKALENIPKGGYLLLEADQTKNTNDRNLAIVRDAEGNYFIYLLVDEQRFDNTMHKDIEFQQGNDNECKIALQIGGKTLKVIAQLTSKRYFAEPAPAQTSEADSSEAPLDISKELSNIKGFNVLPDTHTVFILGKRIQFAPHVEHDFVKVVLSPLIDKTSVAFNSVINGKPAAKTISQTKLEVFLSVVEQLEFLHKNDFVVRDFKPENILFKFDEESQQDKAYIIDYAEFMKLKNSQPTTATFVGTPEYLAPETQEMLLEVASDELRVVISEHLQTTFGGSYTSFNEASETAASKIKPSESEETEIVTDFPVNKAIDIYSLGIMLYECITSNRMSYREGEQKYNLDGTDMLDSNQKPLFWTKQEIVEQIKHDKEFIENNPLLSKMLAKDPQQRCTIGEVKQVLTEMLRESKKLNPHSDLKSNEAPKASAYIDDLLNKFENDATELNKKILMNYISNLQRTSEQKNPEESDIEWSKDKISELKNMILEYTDKFIQLNNNKKVEEKARRTSYKYKPVTVAPSLDSTITIKEYLAQLRIKIEHHDHVLNDLGTPRSFRERYTRSKSTGPE